MTKKVAKPKKNSSKRLNNGLSSFTLTVLILHSLWHLIGSFLSRFACGSTNLRPGQRWLCRTAMTRQRLNLLLLGWPRCTRLRESSNNSTQTCTRPTSHTIRSLREWWTNLRSHSSQRMTRTSVLSMAISTKETFSSTVTESISSTGTTRRNRGFSQTRPPFVWKLGWGFNMSPTSLKSKRQKIRPSSWHGW